MCPAIVPAFNDEEEARAQSLLRRKIAYMGMRKFEEGDWSEIYTDAKLIPRQTWSNLDLDVVHQGLGVEHKMLGQDADLTTLAGKTLMHPAATRSIRVPPSSTPPDEAKDNVLSQYGDLIAARGTRVAETSTNGQSDLRIGWLLWSRDLSEFLYWEEHLLAPDPSKYVAEWVTRNSSGARKSTTNLWIYESDTNEKRFSITGSEAGSKIQPYFDVPDDFGDEGVYHFTPQGRLLSDGRVDTSVRKATAAQLEILAKDLGAESVDELVGMVLEGIDSDEIQPTPEAQVIELLEDRYHELKSRLPDMTDDERMEIIIRLGSLLA